MKKYFIFSCLVLLFTATACSDWTETEGKNIDKLLAAAQAKAYEAYLENLRAYKKTDHPVTFGWFGGWNGESPASRCLYNLPDSTDFVSLWDGFSNLTAAQQADLKRAKEVKGIRALACALLFDIGKGVTPAQPEASKKAGESWETYNKKYWGWVDGDEAKITIAIQKYANAICDTIYKYDLDGFDLDAEPNIPQPFHTNKEMWQGDRISLSAQWVSVSVRKPKLLKAERNCWLSMVNPIGSQPIWPYTSTTTSFRPTTAILMPT